MQQIKLLSKQSVLAATSISHSTLYGLIRQKTFPQPAKIGKRSVWPQHEVDSICAAWVRGADDTELREIVAQIEAARKTPPQV